MKLVVVVLFMAFAHVAMAQEKENQTRSEDLRELQDKIERLQEENNVWRAENAEYRERLEVQGEMEAMNKRQLFIQRKEIETMKDIMRGYILQIDSLNTLLIDCQEEQE